VKKKSSIQDSDAVSFCSGTVAAVQSKKLIIAARLNQSQSAVAGWDHLGLCNCVWCT
jgi:hypothetical protein